MRLTGWHIDGFGHLADLRVDGIGPSLTVVLGPNEAGKSTLHAFLARTIAGHPRANDARGRPLHEPLRGGRHGGSVSGIDARGRTFVLRRFREGSPRVSLELDGQVTTVAGDVARITGTDLDLDAYTRIHAFDADELSAVGRVQDAAVRDLLLDAATAGGGVSLRGAADELASRRDALWTPKARTRPLNALTGDLAAARRRLDEAREEARSWRRRAAERDELDAAITDLEIQRRAARDEHQRVQALQRAWPAAHAAATDRADRAALGDVPQLPDDVITSLRAAEIDREAAAAALAETDASADRASAQLDAIAVDDALAGLAAEVSRLRHDAESHLTRTEELTEARGAAAAAAAAVTQAVSGLGSGWDETAVRRIDTTTATRTALTGAAAAVTAARVTVRQDDARAQDRNEAAEEAATAARRARDAIGDAPAADPAELDAADAAVSTLRRVLPELSRRAEADRAPAATPLWLIGLLLVVVGVATGAATVAGLAARWVEAGLAGGAALSALVGLIGLAVSRRARPAPVASADLRTLADDRDRAAATLGLVKPLRIGAVEEAATATERARRHRDAVIRAQTEAEQAEQRARTAEQRARDAQQRLAAAEQALDRRIEEWRRAATDAGLDPEVPPDVALAVADAVAGALGAITERDRATATVERLTAVVDGHDDRVRAVLTAAGRAPGADLAADLDQLADAIDADRDERARHADIGKDLDRLHSEGATIATRLHRAEARIAQLCERWGVPDADALRALAERSTAAAELERSTAAADAEVARALGGDAAADLRDELAAGDRLGWATREAAIEDRRRELDARHDALVEQRAVANDRLRSLASDDTVATRAQEVAALQAEGEELSAQHDALDGAVTLLRTTLSRWESERQPRVLARAGDLLAVATAGRWGAIRQAGDALVVSSGSDTEPVDVAALSRGAREQLYLSLRLALAGEHAERHEPLPLLVDDAMVHADPERADAVAALLATTAATQQVLVFTCHPATAERLVAADPTTGIIELSGDAGTATWRGRDVGGERRPSHVT